MKEGQDFEISYVANYNYELEKWDALEGTTYPVLLVVGIKGITEVDISFGYNRKFSSRVDYVEYTLHMLRTTCYGFYSFDKEATEWQGV